MSVLHRLSLACLALLLLALPAAAESGTPLAQDEAFALTVSREADGDLVFAWTIAPGYYLYRDHTVATAGQDTAALPLNLSRGESKDDPDFGLVDIWRDKARAILAARAFAGTSDPESIDITYQGCLEHSICYPPTTRTVRVPDRPQARAGTENAAPIAVAAAVPAAISTATPQAAPLTLAPPSSDGPDESTDPVTETAKADGQGFVGRLALKGGGAGVLAAFFGFGVLLAFTPCVFPMYPILAGVIGRGADGRGTRRGLLLSSAYVLGLASALALLGVAAAWSGQNLQIALQSPWAVGAVAVVFVVLAISMFGGFELQLPSVWTSRLSRDGGQGRRSVPSAAGLGFVSALIVGPCVTAPLAGALLYIAQTGDVLLGAAALFFLGLGKGLPLIVFGTAGASFLPKAGPWMDRVKIAFGFVFLGMAWWLAARILPPTATLALGAALALGLAASLGLFRPATSGLLSNLARAAGLAAATWSVLLLVGLGLGSNDPWRPLEPLSRPVAATATPGLLAQPAAVVVDQAGLDRAVAAAAARGRPALLYFTADWCVSCKVMERRAFQDPGVVARLGGVDLIRADVTQDTKAARDMMKRNDVIGPPTLVFLSRTSVEVPDTRVVGEASARQVLETLGQAQVAP